MKKVIASALIIASLVSCTGTQNEIRKPSPTPLVRVKVVENGTISHVVLTHEQKMTLRYRDTVWVDLATHTINDTAQYTMKAILLLNF